MKSCLQETAGDEIETFAGNAKKKKLMFPKMTISKCSLNSEKPA